MRAAAPGRTVKRWRNLRFADALMRRIVGVMAESADRWNQSRSLLKRSRLSLAGGVSSPFRTKAPVPLFLADALGSRITDVDGNQYIDYALAWGPLILGHRHPRLVAAVREQADRPHIYGAQHPLEYQVAELIQKLVPCAERVAFTSSGSEAVQIVLRLARAFTGRRLILKFEGHYHGWMDSVLLSYKPNAEQLHHAASTQGVAGSPGQVANAADNVLVLPWNDAEQFTALLEQRGSEIAAIITEPVLCNSGCIEPVPGFLETVAAQAKKHGALLIFDEVITGFRLDLGGAQKLYGITPDLATFGKAIGGGLPLSAIAGRRDIMETMFTRGVSFGGTFNGNPFSLAAALATLTELSLDGGQPLKKANATGAQIMEVLRTAAQRHGLPLQVTGIGAAFALHFTKLRTLRDYRDTLQDDMALLQRWLLECLREGIYLLPDGRMYVSAVHNEADTEQTVSAMERVFDRLGGS
jgi:glutamate-1-semialdehyde 2,1-aminomutase